MRIALMSIDEARGKSHVILAIDEDEPGKYWSVLDGLGSMVKAVKLGWMAILSMGTSGVSELIRKNNDKYFIMDAKMADVNFINEKITRKLRSIGFNGVIIHGFIGSSNAPPPLLDIFVLVSMSQGPTLYDKSFSEALSYAKEIKRKGIVVPGNRPDLIRLARESFPMDVIISPGIGAQGGRIGCAVRSGADFGIVGRSIYESSDPVKALLELEKEAREARC
jgi:orotidine-5'-phosphate decarboxylase